MKTKTIVMVAIIAALYAIFTLALAPVSYGPIQFRVSEALKVFVLLNPLYALGIGLGTFIANLASPFSGAWDLIFMPLTDIAGGVMAWWLFRLMRRWSIFPPMVLYALTTGLSVGVMLAAFGMGVWYFAALPVIASEMLILMVLGSLLWRALKWVNLR